jgi:hypothetical protein
MLKNAFEKVVAFVACTFEKLDDSLVTPVVLTTWHGVQKTYTVTTDFTNARIAWVKNSLVLPVKNVVGSYVVVPIYKKVTGVAQCTTSIAIQAGAFIDNRLSLVGCMASLVEKSKAVDQCVTSGRITNKVVLPALEGAKTLDKKITNGSVEEFVNKSIDEFQVAKGNRPSSTGTRGMAQGNVTSAGAPVYRH